MEIEIHICAFRAARKLEVSSKCDDWQKIVKTLMHSAVLSTESNTNNEHFSGGSA